MVAPEVAVVTVGVAVAVLLVGRHDLGHGRERDGTRGPATGELGVVGGGPAGEQGGTVSVDDDVVVQLYTPDGVAEIQDQEAMQWGGCHPAPGPAAVDLLGVDDRRGQQAGVRRIGQVADLGQPGRGGVDVLARAGCVLGVLGVFGVFGAFGIL